MSRERERESGARGGGASARHARLSTLRRAGTHRPSSPDHHQTITRPSPAVSAPAAAGSGGVETERRRRRPPADLGQRRETGDKRRNLRRRRPETRQRRPLADLGRRRGDERRETGDGTGCHPGRPDGRSDLSGPLGRWEMSGWTSRERVGRSGPEETLQ